MMGKSYQRKTNRSRRKSQGLDGHAVTVRMADGKACFQMVLPMTEMLFDVANAIEQTASQAGLLMMKAMIDDEVEQLAGQRYKHQPDRQAVRWGRDEGHVVFAGRKVGIDKAPRSLRGRCCSRPRGVFTVSRATDKCRCWFKPSLKPLTIRRQPHRVGPDYPAA